METMDMVVMENTLVVPMDIMDTMLVKLLNQKEKEYLFQLQQESCFMVQEIELILPLEKETLFIVTINTYTISSLLNLW